MNQRRTLWGSWGGWVSLMGVVMALTASVANADVCFRDSYARGVGKVPAACANSKLAIDEGLCYATCQPGWDGKATNCVQNCPTGFRDDGLLCAKPAQPAPYGVGAGFPWKLGDTVGNFDKAADRCRADNPQGCTRDGLLWYPNCKAGFHKSGALICSPNEVKCPSGFADIGVSCTKPIQPRGVGVIPDACSSAQELQAGLCYDRCKPNFNGVAVSCVQQCPASAPHSCVGLVGCGRDAADCRNLVGEPVVNTLTELLIQYNNATGNASITLSDIAIGVVRNAKNSFGGLSAIDWINVQALKAGVNFTRDEFSTLKELFEGQPFTIPTIEVGKLRALVASYKKPQTCRG